MAFARGAMEKAGLKMANFQKLEICPGGDLPKEIEALIAGKTQSQLFLEFKQSDPDADPEADRLAPKRGRLKGQGGASAEQRAAAQVSRDEEELEALELRAMEIADWLLDAADATKLGRLGAVASEKLVLGMRSAIRILETK
jgi:hypothetical protein